MMNRSHIMAIAFLSSCMMHNAQAGMVRDVVRVATGAGMFSSIAYWAGAESNAIAKWVAAGAVGGSLFTTYGRSAWAQLNLRLVDTQLMTLVNSLYEDEARLIAALELLYVSKTFPLVVAFEKLSHDHGCLTSAIETLDGILDELAVDSARLRSFKVMRDQAFKLRTRVEYALHTLRQDPRWVEMVAAKNQEDARKIMSAMQYQVGVQYHWYPQSK